MLKPALGVLLTTLLVVGVGAAIRWLSRVSVRRDGRSGKIMSGFFTGSGRGGGPGWGGSLFFTFLQE